MSHYIFKEKKFIDLGKNMILPLINYADSSIRNYKDNHDYHWYVNLFNNKGLIIDKNIFNNLVQDEIDNHIKMNNAYYKKFGLIKKDNYEHTNYYGNTYRGSNKLKAMKSFYSTKHCIPFEKFIKDYQLGINFEFVDKEKRKKLVYFNIQSINDLLIAHECNKKHKNDGYLCYLTIHLNNKY